MSHHKRKITQEEYDRAIGNFFELGRQLERTEQRNRAWTSQAQGLSFPEKQVLVILEREQF